MLAWFADRDARCGGCDGYLDETTDPARQFGYDVEVLRCHRCHAQARAVRGFGEGGSDGDGLLTQVKDD